MTSFLTIIISDRFFKALTNYEQRRLFQKFCLDLFVSGIAFVNDAANIFTAYRLPLTAGHIGNDQHRPDSIEQMGVDFLLFAGPAPFGLVAGTVDGVCQ